MDELTALLASEIAARGPITFARFMEVALYHSTLGYYAGGSAGREPVGWEGDYVTSVDLHPLWGRSIARQLEQMWQLLGRPPVFAVVEPGAGRGLLARDVWRYALEQAPEWAAVLRYTLADRAPAGSPLRMAREERLAGELARLGVPPGATRWADTLEDALPASGITGCVTSNELVDALPVHVVESRGGELREVYVDVASGRLVEVLGPFSSPEVGTYLDDYRVPWRSYPDGWRAEVNLAALDWMRTVARGVHRGFALTIDYGNTARRLYTRHRRHGTLAVYARHQFGGRPLAHPGRQDLTAHVNFSALIRAGREDGLRLAGMTTQAAFLTALGIHAAHAPSLDAAAVRLGGSLAYLRQASDRGAVSALLNPAGMGGFNVLVQQRGVPGAGRSLLGLRGQRGGRIVAKDHAE